MIPDNNGSSFHSEHICPRALGELKFKIQAHEHTASVHQDCAVFCLWLALVLKMHISPENAGSSVSFSRVHCHLLLNNKRVFCVMYLSACWTQDAGI